MHNNKRISPLCFVINLSLIPFKTSSIETNTFEVSNYIQFSIISYFFHSLAHIEISINAEKHSFMVRIEKRNKTRKDQIFSQMNALILQHGKQIMLQIDSSEPLSLEYSKKHHSCTFLDA